MAKHPSSGDTANALFQAGCEEHRPQVAAEARSLEDAIRSALLGVNKAGHQVQRLELDTAAVAELAGVRS